MAIRSAYKVRETGPDLHLVTRRRRIINWFLRLVELGALAGLVMQALVVWEMVRPSSPPISRVKPIQRFTTEADIGAATPVVGEGVLQDGSRQSQDELQSLPVENVALLSQPTPQGHLFVEAENSQTAPGPARHIQIPAIGVDAPISQGITWEQLKNRVGQLPGSALPGEKGNLVLSAHNNVYGALFRNLDWLQPGDTVVISNVRQDFTYVVRHTVIVEPDDLWVTLPTGKASVSLISCYPRLLSNKRIVVFADLLS